jgi:WhiB family redox-sensing transcriptional regulator
MNPLRRINLTTQDSQPIDPIHTTPEHNPNWRNQANCQNRTHEMFPNGHKDITYIRQARAICRECPVQQACLAYALEFPPQDMHGVWAGYTSRQLGTLQRRMGLKPARPTIAQMWGDRT